MIYPRLREIWAKLLAVLFWWSGGLIEKVNERAQFLVKFGIGKLPYLIFLIMFLEQTLPMAPGFVLGLFGALLI